MIPTRSELNLAPAQAEQPVQDPANVDLEQGRIEPTLKVTKISSQLQNTREQRENNLLRTLSRTGGPPVSNLGRHPSSVAAPLSPSSEVIEEEEDLGLQPLDPKDQQPDKGQQEEQTTTPQHWYPDDAASAVTEHEQEGDLDGDYIHHEDIPLPAYDAEADEIHNLHTHWSVIRLRFREPLAELLAVCFISTPL
jgi:aquaglyceroporin related protein